jgi:excisionase family DNA binding protein
MWFVWLMWLMWYALSMTTTHTGQVFTIAEIARVLRVSDETIRRKISAGELEAVEVSSTPRKTYRIPEYALVRWLGAEKAKQLFGVRHGFEEFRELLLKIPEKERIEILEEAVVWARAQRPEPELTGRVLTKEEIAERFQK